MVCDPPVGLTFAVVVVMVPVPPVSDGTPKSIVPPTLRVIAPRVMLTAFGFPFWFTTKALDPVPTVVLADACTVPLEPAPRLTVSVPPPNVSADAADRMFVAGVPAAEKSAIRVPPWTVVGPVYVLLA